MKKLFSIAIVTLLAAGTSNAQDAKAKEVLDKFAVKTQSYSTISAEFTVTLENKKDKVKDNQNGKLLLKDDMFKIVLRESDVYSNGKTRWTYLKESNEVNVQSINPNDPNVLSNPTKLFSGNFTDFKYAYKGIKKDGGVEVEQIDLYPKNIKAAYSIIKLNISTATGLPKSIVYLGKDGVNYTITFTKISPNIPLANSTFVFNERAFPNVEIIDMR